MVRDEGRKNGGNPLVLNIVTDASDEVRIGGMKQICDIRLLPFHDGFRIDPKPAPKRLSSSSDIFT